MATARSRSATTEVIAYQEDQLPIKLMYDTWTPRPHFIAVQCTPKQDADVDELQVMYEIIGRFLQQNSQFDKDAILCFRRGQWNFPKTGKWQARLCVSKEPYLERARIAIKPENIPSSNKDWMNATDIKNGMNQWYTRKIQKYVEKKNKCIQKGILNERLAGNVLLSTFNSNTNKFELVWTSPAPRIGIIARSPASTTLADLYNFMSQVVLNIEKELRKSDKKMTTFDCHLCLYVRGQSGTTVTCRQDQILSEDGRLTTNENIVGYIQMCESQYLQWLPHESNQIWFNAFCQAEHFVET